MKIKSLEKKDLDRTKEFLLRIIKNDFGYDFNPEWHSDIIDLEKIYIDDSRSCFFIIEDGEEIIGTIAGRPYHKDYPILKKYNYTPENTLGIWRHYIRKDLRGKGLGTLLLNKLERFAKDNKYSKIYLHTQKTISGSLEYWLAKGYIITVESGDEFQTVHMEKRFRNG
jgi:GNAT superfamily N-acetyltransferase